MKYEVLSNNTSILHNIENSFYYNGIEISKENFDIREFAKDKCLFNHRLMDFRNIVGIMEE